MARHFVTLGQDNKHIINDHYLDKDCVVEFEAEDSIEGRKKAFEYFGKEFCMEYHKEFSEKKLKYYPRGIIKID